MDTSLLSKLFINTTDDLIFLLSVESAKPPFTFRFHSVNPAYLHQIGFTEAIIGQTVQDTLPPDVVPFVLSKFTESMLCKQTIKYEESVIFMENALIVETALTPFFDELGQPSYLLGVTRDITERKQAEQIIRESEERYRTLVQLSPDAIIIHDHGRIVFCNDAAARLVQVDHPDELLGADMFDFVTPAARRSLEMRARRLYGGTMNPDTAIPPFETKVQRRSGEIVKVEGTSAFIEHQGRKVVQVILRDVTRRSIEKERLQRLSELDGLTNIANRRYFDVIMRREVSRARRNKLPISVFLFDIDNFKRYNDLYGHLAGDDCIKQITGEAKRVLKRPGDFLARFGGEEFTVLLPETDTFGAQTVAERLRERIEALQIPHLHSDVKPYVTISVGVAGMTRPSSTDIVPMLERADQALYEAKRKGKNRVEVCNR